MFYPLRGAKKCFSRLQSHSHSLPRSPWYLLDQPRKDEKLSWPWSHPVDLNPEPLDWESSTLTTKPFTCMLNTGHLTYNITSMF